MTYLQFLIICLVIPLCFLSFGFYASKLPNKKSFFYGIFALAIIAFIYTTPWDNYLLMKNVWSYGDDRVLGVIGYVPIEEYCFFILQTYLTGLICFGMQKFVPVVKRKDDDGRIQRHAILFFYVIFFAIGGYSLFSETSFYLGLILVWALPIIIFQWLVGARYLIANKELFLLATLVPTFYLWVVDAIALKLNIWKINPEYILGYSFMGLPLEEAVFFLVTNLMLVQGLILFVVMKDYCLLKINGAFYTP